MKNVILVLSVFLLLLSCKKQVDKSKDSVKTSKINADNNQQNSTITTYDYKGLKPLLEKKDDKIYVVNFWATWCAPCVKELPYFEKINKDYADKNVEVILVSLDFPKQVEKKLIPFINKRKLKSKVVYLNDTNEDVWIKAIDESWSGAIPATIIYNKNNRKFYEQSFDYITLENELKSFLNP